MRISKLRFAMLGLVCASRVFASACPVIATPLSTYIGFGAGGCTISGETVDNFAFTVGATSAGLSALTASAIMVTPSTIINGYQLFFSATGATTSTGFTVSGSQFANYEIDFTWDPVVVGAEDQMFANSPVFPGTATVTTDLCAGSIFGVACPPATNTLTVFNDGQPADAIPTAFTAFTPVTVVGTQSFITLDANGASSAITGFTTSVFAPEPGTFVFAAIGLLALVLRCFGGRCQPSFQFFSQFRVTADR
jgi:hypothetical protein